MLSEPRKRMGRTGAEAAARAHALRAAQPLHPSKTGQPGTWLLTYCQHHSRRSTPHSVAPANATPVAGAALALCSQPLLQWRAGSRAGSLWRVGTGAREVERHNHSANVVLHFKGGQATAYSGHVVDCRGLHNRQQDPGLRAALPLLQTQHAVPATHVPTQVTHAHMHTRLHNRRARPAPPPCSLCCSAP